jgi:hypothetical protein
MHELKESVCEVVTPTWDDKCVPLRLFPPSLASSAVRLARHEELDLTRLY